MSITTRRLSHVNRLLEDGERAFSSQFIERLNEMVTPIRRPAIEKSPVNISHPVTSAVWRLSMSEKTNFDRPAL